MASCTFIGHRDTPEKIEPMLQSALIDLVQNKTVNMFYVGNHGHFDYMVRKNLKLLKHDYPHIHYAVVLAYMPGKKNDWNYEDDSCTIYPEGLENAHPKYAIIKRNVWMIDRSDYVVAYISHAWGGAAQCKETAEKKGKIVLNLADGDQTIKLL